VVEFYIKLKLILRIITYLTYKCWKIDNFAIKSDIFRRFFISKNIPLSYNISGGSARHQEVKPKTWRIFTFADARMTPLVPNPRGNYH
jgi:hypothetical protein